MRIKKECRVHIWAVLLLVIFYSCSRIGFDLPQGPQGASGKSAYEIWKEEVVGGRINWPSDRTEVADFLAYIKGEKGDKGDNGLSSYELWKAMIAQGGVSDPHNPSQAWPASKNTEGDFWDFLCGRDGQTPHVGDNGTWWIGNTDTRVKAAGTDGINGRDGISAYDQWKRLVTEGSISWPSDQLTQNDFFLYLKGRDGANGVTPHVGTNGNWFVGAVDTGVRAAGRDGAAGADGLSPYVGNNGNWWVGTTDTGVKVTGRDGVDGKTPVIKDGFWWVGDTNTGVKAVGTDGINGRDGVDGKTPVIKNGTWWIGETNTGVSAVGTNGTNGVDGTSPHIGDNGNWFIGTTDTGVSASGQAGSNGAAGASAYELWVADVKAGRIRDKQGLVWPVEKNTMEDFYQYLSGAKGDSGKSAYELWKETVAAGNVGDPKHPGQAWPADKVSELDFFSYLTGKDGVDGVNGTNGLSAYELWKADLAARCNTAEALVDYKNGGTWNCEKNTLADFYEYLRGKDGKDGKDGQDGRPGEPGKPGAEVTIIRGVPNVIAQYSQSEYGEYVRSSDGGVLYKVYDEMGEVAPGAQVKGMPGIAPEKVYTANEKGEFIIPKEDLPEIQSVDLRWGAVKEVTLKGKSAQVSAKNTYVPNRVHMRIILRDNNSNSLSKYQDLYFLIQRRMNPEDEWQNIPAYLPNSGNRYLDAYRVSDKENPKSIQMDKKLYSGMSFGTYSGSLSYYYNIYTYRFMEENPGKFKNNQNEYWDKTDVYYSVKAREVYYGEEYQWNGVCLLAPYQMGPVLKTLKLKALNSEKEASFAQAEGTFDFSKIDFSKMYKSLSKCTVLENGMDLVVPETYTEEEAKKIKMAYIEFSYISSAGRQTASSSNNSSSFEAPAFKVFTPFLNSTISISSNSSSSLFYRFTQGYLRKKQGEEENKFEVVPYTDSYQLPAVEVTYEP